MGKIADRFANKQVKDQYKKDTFGAVDLMFELGDGAWANENRGAILAQCLDQVMSNIDNIIANLVRGKMTRASGVKFGFERDKLTRMADYEVWIEDPAFMRTINEFRSAYAKNPQGHNIQFGYMGEATTKMIAPFAGFSGSTGTIVFTKDRRFGHLLRFMPNDGIARHDFDPDNAEATVEEMAKFVA